MPLGPVFRYEMLAAGRKRRYFLAASLVGLGMLGLLATTRAATWAYDDRGLGIAEAAALSAAFYSAFAWATMLGVLLVTPAVAAGAIASERERRTIEYLFATDLSNGEIVLDKLFARLLTVGKLVLATLPVLAIFRLLGGVSGRLLLLHFVMLASTATLVASIALAVSVCCARARDAVPRALGATFLWLISFPIALSIAMACGVSQRPWLASLAEQVLVPAATFWDAANPLLVLGTSAGVGSRVLGVDVQLGAIALMVGLQAIGSAALLGWCVWRVRRIHLSSSATPKASPRAGRAARRSGPYETRPMLWKEMYAATAPQLGRAWVRRLGWGLLCLLVAAPLVIAFGSALNRPGSRVGGDYLETATALACTCGSVLLLMAGARAAGLVTSEKERDTWLSLLTTDLSAAEIVTAKLWGVLYAVRWPLIGITAMPLVGAVFKPAMLPATLGFVAAVLIIGWAASAIGLAFSLRMTSSTKAVGATVFTLAGIALFYPAVATFVLASMGPEEEVLAVVAWPPLAPMLLAIPLMAVSDSLDGVLWVTFFVGLLFYAFLGVAVTLSLVSAFDRLCQRSVARVSSTPVPSAESAAAHQPEASHITS